MSTLAEMASIDLPAPVGAYIYPTHPVAAFYGRPEWTGDDIRDHLTDMAMSALPTLWENDPTDAIEAVTNLLLTQYEAMMGAELDTALPDIYRSLWEQTPESFTDSEQGLLDASPAHDPAPRVFTTTAGMPIHRVSNEGTYRTFRAHIKVMDSNGNTGWGHALSKQADALLGKDPETHEWADKALRGQGTQDQTWPGTVWHSVPKGDQVEGMPGFQWADAADFHGTASTTVGDAVIIPIRDGADIAVGQKRAKRKLALPTCSYPVRHQHWEVIDPTYAAHIGHELPYVQTSSILIKRLACQYAGRRIIGHGHWQTIGKADKQGNHEPSTIKARAVRAKQKAQTMEPTNAASATERLTQVARELHDMRTELLEQTEARSTNQTDFRAPLAAKSNLVHKLKFPDGTVITLSLSTEPGARYRISGQPKGGKRWQSTTTAPQFVGAIVANHLS